ncbi:methylation-associated defense system ATP-binding protein MAD8 [Streptomyces zingiberis]|uniref:ATP-binding protein n=1 Tax=Streptomyces zingiberis TaxID=2053010 RepID=A0ABX1C458_9ACTN|nr:ATP-binding protein [Streptomyces zingiberis]NJQ03403.1 ATP-binding protein [Streptomyces zingiberis]
MSTIGLAEITPKDLREALEGVLVPRLAKLVGERTAGHCMRITEVEAELAAPLVRRLRGALGPDATVCVLGTANDLAPDLPFHDVTVTSTKLVELRNRTEDEVLPGPLLVFVPPGMRVSAEDSFGIATFEEVPLGDAYGQLAEHLLDQVPDRLRQGVDELLAALRDGSDRRMGDRAVAMYLLTLQANAYREQVAGAAVFHFGLVPDFDLFADPTLVRERVERNRGLVDKLTGSTRSERQRVLDLGLSDADFAARLAGFATRCGLEDPVAWTRRIVVERENWGLSFGNWHIDERRRATVSIEVQELGLPAAGDNPEDLRAHPALEAMVGQPYLLAGEKGVRQVTARFSVQPDPRKVDGLERFRVEIVSENGGPIGRIAYRGKGKTATAEFRAPLQRLNKIDWEEGWHYVRVTPLDASDVALDVAPSAHDQPGGESERFYVIPDAETEEPPDRSAGRYDGVVQALRSLQLEALAAGDDPSRVTVTDIRWKAITPRSPQRVLNARIHTAGSAEIRLAPLLVQIQQDLLARPSDTTLRRLMLNSNGTVESPTGTDENLERELSGRAAEAYDTFLAARHAYFTAVSGQSDERAGGADTGDLLVSEAIDFEPVREVLVAYAEAYAELVAAQSLQVERSTDDTRGAALVTLARLQQIDCAAITLTDGLGQRDTILLVSPTHPLRALWLATWSAMGQEWVGRLGDADKRQIIAARESFLGTLSPLGFPFAVPRQDGRLMAAADNLTPYWGAYLPSETSDPRGLLGRLTTALNLPTVSSRTSNGASALSGTALADRIERYVRLHPYVRTLVLNVVNAGRGEIIADALLELQQRTATRDLTYDIRLCATDPEAQETGAALGELLSAQNQIASAEAEAFLHTAGGTRTAKLVYSVRSVQEFNQRPAEFDAHLTILIDAFGGEQYSSVVRQDIVNAPVHGLVQTTASTYADNEQQIVWRTAPRLGTALATEDAEDLATLMSRMPGLLASAAANVATAGQAPRNVPCTVLSLGNADRALLYQAHQAGDWVVTIDRTLGLEYFDHAGQHGRPEYVIDYAPSLAGGLGHQIMVSSNSVDELRTLLGPTAEQHGLDVEERHLNTFFEQLRLLSGNLAFKLASTAPNQRTEVLGLSLARLYLDYQDVLHNQIVVPLDAHPELYSEARRLARELGDAFSFQRSDLALFHLNARERTVVCHLIEVKCYTALDDIGAYQRLKTKVAQQLERSETVLAESFDPARTTPDRVDRTVKNLVLGSMLRFYLERAARHGTMGHKPREAAHALLDSLDKGYKLRFTRSGLIFDLARSGTDRELDDGVHFHRIGSDLITELINAIPTVRPGLPELGDTPVEDQAPEPDGEATAPTLALLQLSVPRLADAEFRAQEAEAPPESNSEDAPVSESAVTEQDEADVRASTDTPSASSDQQDRTDSVTPPSGPDPVESEPGPERDDVHDSAHGGPAPGDTDLPPRSATMHAPQGFPDAVTVNAPLAPSAAASAPASSTPGIFLGVDHPSPQHGLLGEVAGRTVALDLNETHTISLFGVQGGGKSYTLGSIIEMASLPSPPVNELPHPLATVVFHYSQTMDYAPEFTSMARPNDDKAQLRVLKERYGAEPRALEDVLLLAPADQVADRQRQFPGIAVQPLAFSSAELQASHWRFLMGAVGNQSTYIRQLTRIMRAHRNDLRLDVIRQGVADSGMPDHVKQLAQERLNLASDYIDDNAQLTSLIRPGRLIIVDLRDEFIEKDEALGLFVVLMQLFAEARSGGEHFNKLVVFDEAHKYIDSPDLVAGLVETVREMRHKGMSVLVASQDPPSVPISLIELSDHVILHKFTSPAWLKHLQKANAAFSGLRSEQMSQLQPGEAYVWASKATDKAFTHGAVRVRCRPRVTKHGGATKTASGEAPTPEND